MSPAGDLKCAPYGGFAEKAHVEATRHRYRIMILGSYTGNTNRNRYLQRKKNFNLKLGHTERGCGVLVVDNR